VAKAWSSNRGESVTETDDSRPDATHSGYVHRIRDLADEARAARESFTPPEATSEPPDERALRCARDGVGPVVALYVEAHTARWDVAFSAEELRLLHRALNDWLTCYARCYGVDLDASFSIREAAELLLKTHNVRDTAQLLTCVPSRRE
jgi:hypothetical protein